MGFKAALEATKVTKTAAKKVNVPVLTNVPDEVTTAAAAFLEKTREKKEIEAELAIYGDRKSTRLNSSH